MVEYKNTTKDVIQLIGVSTDLYAQKKLFITIISQNSTTKVSELAACISSKSKAVAGIMKTQVKKLYFKTL